MADSQVQGYTTSQFSDTVIDLQSKSFCCSSADTRKLVRFFKNIPGVYQNQKIIFNSSALDLSYFSQEVESFKVDSVQILAGATAEVQLNSKFLFILVSWPVDALASNKIIELVLHNQYYDDTSYVATAYTQPGYIEPNREIPGAIGTSSFVNYVFIKDIFITNSIIPLRSPLLINNATSPYDVTVYVMQAK